MKIAELRWVEMDDGIGFSEAKCAGTSQAASSARLMKCSRNAVIWRVLVLEDKTEVPKPVCGKHRGTEKAKWEAIMAGEEFTALPTPRKARSKKIADRAAAISQERKQVQQERIAARKKAVCQVCGGKVQFPFDLCNEHRG